MGSQAQGTTNDRGGGPSTAPGMGTDQRSQMLHQASPHIVTIETQLRAARDTSQGLERLASLAGNRVTPEYGEHMGVLTSAIQSDLGTVRTHLDHLRTSVQDLGMMDRFRSDLAQADLATSQARQTLDQVQQDRQQPNSDAARIRDGARQVNSRLGTAKSAVERIERGLR
jgi:hypothetical protein